MCVGKDGIFKRWEMLKHVNNGNYVENKPKRFTPICVILIQLIFFN